MSHYAVLVISETGNENEIDNLLYPYDENLCEHKDDCDPKWDWWSVGGRFEGYLTLKDGSSATTAKVCDLAVGQTEDDRNSLMEEYRDLARNGDEMFKAEYYVGRYGDAETYADAHAPNVFRAVVTPDDGWHEAGPVGWFGICQEDQEGWKRHLAWCETLFEGYEDCVATVVDCHI